MNRLDTLEDSVIRVILLAIADRLFILRSWSNWFPWNTIGKRVYYCEKDFLNTFLREVSSFILNDTVEMDNDADNEHSSFDDADNEHSSFDDADNEHSSLLQSQGDLK
jgi:hypothetical protein